MKFLTGLLFLSAPAFADVLDLNGYGGVACSDPYQAFGLHKVHTHISYDELWTVDGNGAKTMYEISALKVEFVNTQVTKRTEYEQDETGKYVVTEMLTDITVTDPADSSVLFQDTVFCRKSESDHLD